MADKIVKCELQTWRTNTDKDGNETKTLVDNAEKESEQEEVYALVLNRVYDASYKLISATLTINSPLILTALREVIKTHPTIASDFTATTEIKAPFQALIHNWDELFQYVEDTNDDDARMHMNLLLELMDVELGPDKKRYDNQQASGSIDYDAVWTIFKPGDTVITTVKGYPWLLKVVKSGYEETNVLGKFLEVKCLYIDHDGEHMGTAKENFLVRQKVYFSQDDPCKITALPVYPRHYYQGDDLEQSLVKRGKLYLELSKHSAVKNYDGEALAAKEPPPSYWHPDEGEDPLVWSAYTETGRIVIDRKTFSEEHLAQEVTPKRDIGLAELQLCPPFCYGYSCTRKTWCKFFLSNVIEPKWQPEPFKDLALPKAQKHLVEALVSSHEFPDNSRDQSLQKGKGLVCLLYGPPGAGKTLTAECSAELTHKALFSCTMSELNEYNYASHFEMKLQRVLRLATAWKAIILLDEADVFLESRQDDSSGSTERNALVAVFLKNLEYFSGIIFLTTNRIQVFDSAMKSRVHLALGFQAPNQATRRRIWASQLKKLPTGVLQTDIEELLDAVEGESVNGREISNSILTAATLARYNKESLQLKHLDMVMGVRRDFETHLKRKATLVRDSSERAAKRVSSFPIRQNSILSDALHEEPDEM